MAATAEIIEDLECRILRRIRLFPEGAFAPNSSHFEWLVCSSKFGIGLTLLPDNRIVSYQTANIHALPKQSEANDPEVTNLPSRTTDYFQSNVQISFVRLSCNERVLAFGVDSPSGAFIHVFDLFAFSPITDAQPFPLATIKASSGNGKITCLEWNPESEDVFTVGTSDGSLATIKYVLESPQNFSIIGQITMPSYATCLSWSRKGKQLSVGDASGRLHQLKPELTSVRNVEPPQEIPNLTLPLQCAGVFWVATTDWLIAYRQVNDPLKLTLTLLTVKKNQPPAWTFFGDLTFQRPNSPHLFDTSLHFVPLMNWNMVFIFAHRSPDFAIIGQRNGNWIAFVMEKYNITMPIDANKSDTYPIGAAFDFTSNSNVKLDCGNSESPTIAPQPTLHVLSSGGLLLPYNICSLDQSRPSLIMASTAFNIQNVMNGPQPANFQPRQQSIISNPIQQETPKFSATIPQQQPITSQSAEIQQHPVTSQSVQIQQQPITNQVAQIQQQKVEDDIEKNANLQAEFEKTLIEYCNSKSLLINELESISANRELLAEKANNFDIDCIESLWELYKKVQYSLDDGIQSVDINSRKAANLTGRLKQAENIWKKHLSSTPDQKKRIVMPSSTLDDLISAQKCFQQLEAKFDKIEEQFKTVTADQPKDSLDLPFKEEIGPISAAEQMRINKVNDEIAKRVLKFAKRVETLRQQVRFLKFHSKKKEQNELDDLNLANPANTSTPKRILDQTDTSINSLTNDIQHLLLIVDGKSDFSPFPSKSNASKNNNSEESRNQRQCALKDFLTSKTGTVQIQRVCPKKLIVDETPISKSTPLRSRVSAANNELNDQRLKQQITIAKQSILQSKLASPVSQIASPSNSFGSNVDATSILNAAKASAVINKPAPPIPQLTPQVVKTEPLVQAPSIQPAKTEPSNFSFASLGKSMSNENQQKSQENVLPKSKETVKVEEQPRKTPFSFAPKKDESIANQQPTASSFSFLPKKDESTNQPTTVAPKDSSVGLSSAFGSLTAGQQQPVSTQPASTSVSFSFTPSKPIAEPTQQTPANPTGFSLASKPDNSTIGATSPFGNLNTTSSNTVQPNNPVSFSFAPKTDNTSAQQQSASSPFGQNTFGNTQQQQSSTTTTGWSSFGGSATNQNKSFFGGNTGNAANTQSSSFGSGVVGFSQDKPSAFGQIAPQQSQSPFGSNQTQQPQQQKSAFGSVGFASGPPSFTGTGFGNKPAFGSAPANNTTGSGFGSFSSGASSGGFSAFANKGGSFGQLAQQSQNQPSAFGSNQASTFGSGFGSQSSTFSAQPSTFGTQPSTFGNGSNSAFGGGSTFASPQQNQS